MDDSDSHASHPPGRPVGTTAEAMAERRAAEGLDHLGLPLEPDPNQPRGKRLRPQHQDEVRAKIQASRLVKLLQDNAEGTLKLRGPDGQYVPAELSPGRIKSAEILLAKSLSTLSATEVVSVNANDRMSESEILGKIADLLKADPRLLQMVGTGGSTGRVIGRVIEAEPVEPMECVICGGYGLPGGCGACGADESGGG